MPNDSDDLIESDDVLRMLGSSSEGIKVLRERCGTRPDRPPVFYRRAAVLRMLDMLRRPTPAT